MRQQVNEFLEQHKVLAYLFDYGGLIVKSYLFVFILTSFIMKPICVQGSSMYPTLKEGNIGVSNIFAKTWEGVQRFDVVIVMIEDELWVKRVIALPNERIAYQNDVLYINGEKMEEPFLDREYVQEKKTQYHLTTFTNDFKSVKLEEEEYFLMGDNRFGSLDSRRIGAIRKDQIVSKDTFILIP